MVTTGDPPWLENPRPGAPSTNLAFSSARSGRSCKMDLEQGTAVSLMLQSRKHVKETKKNIDIITYLDRNDR